MTKRIPKKSIGPLGSTIGWLEVGVLLVAAPVSAMKPDDPRINDAAQSLSGASTATVGDTGTFFHDDIVCLNMITDASQRPKPPRRLPITMTRIITDTGTVDS